MTIARTTGFLIGSSKTAGVPLPAGSTFYGGSKDLLGDTTSTGKINLYLCCSAPTPADTLSVKVLLDLQPDTGTGFVNPLPIQMNRGSVSGSQRVFLGRFEVGRYVSATLVNDPNGGCPLTNVALEYELEKTS